MQDRVSDAAVPATALPARGTAHYHTARPTLNVANSTRPITFRDGSWRPSPKPVVKARGSRHTGRMGHTTLRCGGRPSSPSASGQADRDASWGALAQRHLGAGSVREGACTPDP